MIQLYNYQQAAVTKAIRILRQKRRALVVMAPGLGKTITPAAILKAWSRKARKHTLFLCHENRILDQARLEFRRVLDDDFTYGTFHGEKRDETDRDILFASFQTMRRHVHKFRPDEFDCLIVDESHHGKAPTFEKVINYFQPKDWILGITATPDREDEYDIRDIFGSEIVNIPLEMGIANEWLTSLEYRLITDNIDATKLRQIAVDVLQGRKRISIRDLNELLFIEARDEEVVAEINRYSGKGIIFCESVAHAEHFLQFLPNAHTYHSRKTKQENRSTLEMFRQGEIEFIIVVDKFNEGIDIPDAERIVFLRVTDSKRIFLQQLGRGLRKAPGKEKVIVLDFVGNCNRLQQVKEIIERVRTFAPPNPRNAPVVVSGKGFEFIFQDEQVEILGLIKVIRQSLYETWQEASVVAIALKIKSEKEYSLRYKEDFRLPSAPCTFYSDFPGYPMFFGRERIHRNIFYKTWQEASDVCKKEEIRSRREYYKHYRADPLLPSCPDRVYPDFPSWSVFLGTSRRIIHRDDAIYPTVDQASYATQSLGIRSILEYRRRYKEDDRLPSNPELRYKNFPGWDKFLVHTISRWKAHIYDTWQNASGAVIRLGIQSRRAYKSSEYKKDPKLPSNPEGRYLDFPGWDRFLGRS